MKKFYTLLAVMAGVSTLAIAQTVESPLTLEGGSAEYTWEGDNTSDTYWIYTNTENHGVLLSVNNTSLGIFSTSGSRLNSQYSNGSYVYPVGAGSSVLVGARYSSYSPSVSFTYTATEINFDGSATAEAPATLVPGTEVWITAEAGYLQYAATEDGVLSLASSSYVSGAQYSDGTATTSFTFDYNSSGSNYLAKVAVVAGKTYTFTIPAVAKLTSELTHPTLGSTYDYAFPLTSGDNTLPAAFGEYWYSFTPTEAGNLVISGTDAQLAGCTIVLYNSAYYAANGYSSTASSTAGTFALRSEVSVGTTYYMKVTKNDATSADQTFQMEVAPFEAGDRVENPIVLTSGESQTLKSASGTYYYAIDVPSDNGNMILDLTSTCSNSSSYLCIYESTSYSYYGSSFYGANAANVNMTLTAGKRYIFMWVSNEEQAINFTATLSEIEAGDTYDKPLEAVEGGNILTGAGTKYYAYTATLTGKLSVLPSDVENTTITFPQGSSSYSSNYTATMENGAYVIDAVAGRTYVIKIATTAENLIFVISEREYVQGETDSDPIAMDGDEYVLGNETVNVWLSYTVQNAGVLTLGGTMACDNDNYVEYKKQGGYSSRAYNGDGTVTAQFPVNEGDIYLLHIISPNVQPDATVTITIADYEAGQSVDKAITLQPEVADTLPTPSRILPTWVKATLTSGTLTITGAETGSASGYIYKSYEDAVAGTNGSYFSMTNYDYNTYQSLDYAVSTVNIELEGESVCYIKFENSYASNLVVTLSGSAVKTTAEDNTTAISSIAAGENKGAVRVFDLAGRRVNAESFTSKPGTYIICADGETRKVIIK